MSWIDMSVRVRACMYIHTYVRFVHAYVCTFVHAYVYVCLCGTQYQW